MSLYVIVQFSPGRRPELFGYGPYEGLMESIALARDLDISDGHEHRVYRLPDDYEVPDNFPGYETRLTEVPEGSE